MQDPRNVRKEAWSAEKLAVRAYARDPTETNAHQVEIASRKIQQLDVCSLWHQMQWRWLTERSGPRAKERDLPEERSDERPDERMCGRAALVKAPQAVSIGNATVSEESLLDKLQRGPKQRIQKLVKSSK